jgi:hypothetical protein
VIACGGAFAFGVPPLLLGLLGDNTFSNYTEANRAFWRQPVLDVIPDASQQRSDRESRAIVETLDCTPGFPIARFTRVGNDTQTHRKAPMSDILNAILERGDLAHLSLFLWACAATAQAYLALRELSEATRRLDAFVRELARFNRRCRSDS